MDVVKEPGGGGGISGDSTVVARGADAGSADYAGLGAVNADHYVVAETVAQGGMGRVLRAHDRRLGRDVAIKELIRSSPELAIRFEREVRITARLQHPSIVTIHEAGVWHDGEPYYAMQLVSGRALDAVARDASTIGARLALVPHVIAVAEALAYAHSRGVIHRDLKPSNVLVGEFGETVVIDWGLAKDMHASDDSATPLPRARGSGAETVFGAVIGTPAFMPPEQARGDRVDARADVYAIGAMLYAVLAGRAPFAGDSAEAILDRVIDERPASLATLVPDAPQDLLAIVGKAMARVPDNRYADARELAHDLRRFQTGQLVGARRYTKLQRTWRFLAKHRAIVTVAATATAVIAVLAGISIARVVDERDRAQAARVQADLERRRAEGERVRADTARSGAEGLVSFMLTELKPKLERVGRLDVMGDVATHVDRYYSSLPATDEPVDAGAILRRVAALQVLGDVLYNAGDSTASNRSYREAIALATPLASGGGDAAIALAKAQTELAASLLEDGKLDDAQTLLERSRTELEAVPDHASVAIELGMVHRRLGTLAFQRGKLDESLAQLAQCFDVTRAVLPDPKRRHDASVELAKCYDRYSDAESARSNWPGAEQAARMALELRQSIARDDPGDLATVHGIGVSWDKLFVLATEAGNIAEAKLDAAQIITTTEPLVRRDPDNADWSRQLAVGYERVAQLTSSANQPAEAAAAMGNAISVLDRIAARDTTSTERAIDVADAIGKQASYLLDAHDPEAALGVLKRASALATRASSAAPDNVQYAWSVASLDEQVGDVYVVKRQRVEAIAAYRAGLAVYDALLPHESSNTDLADNAASTRFKLGELLAAQSAERAEGLAAMTDALAALHRLRDAHLLSKSAERDLEGLEARFAQTRKLAPP